MLLSPSLIQYHTEKTESARAAGLDKPVCTVDASNRYGLTCANLVEYYGGGRPLDVQSPMHTVTSHDREAVVAAHVVKYYSGVDGEKAGEPLPTVTAIDHNAVCAAHVVKYKRDEVGTRPSEPLPTQTAGGVFGCCKAVLYKISTSERLHHWPQIRDLLNLYCGYALGEDDLLLLSIGVPTADWDNFRVDMLVRKSHGCTFRELLVLEHPDKADARFSGGCAGCPDEYGYEPENGTECLCEKNLNTKKSVPQICTECWDRIVPGSEGRNG